MKALKIVFAFCLFVVFNATGLKAQVDDTLPPVFDELARIGDLKIIDWNSTYFLAKGRSAIVRSNVSALGQKKVMLPPNIKEVKIPLVLKRGNNCYQIGCQPGPGCSSCKMYWKDINRDGKVQPRGELRCVCTNGKSQCKLVARRTKC